MELSGIWLRSKFGNGRAVGRGDYGAPFPIPHRKATRMTTLVAPRTLPNGARTWLSPEVSEFSDRLRDIDPRLALVQHTDNSWSIWRVGESGEENVICRSKPGASLGPQVLQRLVEGDTRRRGGGDFVEKMIRHNDKVVKDAEDAEVESKFIAIDRMLSKAWKGHVASNIEDLSI